MPADAAIKVAPRSAGPITSQAVPAMNLTKYHSSGRLYTAQEARTRAYALFRQRFVYKDEHRAYNTPYNIGRNAGKRAMRQAEGIRK